ncbi:MAG: DUF4286 family protein [Sphingobacteriales bacterium]|nr:DUF4286 family protein [Sphingobacteriales bacterium]
MIIYNVTIKVHSAIQHEWLDWLKQEHIPEVMNTGCFTDFTILRLLEIDDAEGPSYAIQYRAESKALYNQYIEKFAGIMRQRSFDKWGDQFIAFRSVLQVVN